MESDTRPPAGLTSASTSGYQTSLSSRTTSLAKVLDDTAAPSRPSDTPIGAWIVPRTHPRAGTHLLAPSSLGEARAALAANAAKRETALRCMLSMDCLFQADNHP